MWFDVAAAAVGLAALIAIVATVSRHLGSLANVNVDDQPEAGPNRLKRDLLEQRLRRRLQHLSGPAFGRVRGWGSSLYGTLHRAAERLVELEETYRRRLLRRPLGDVLAHQQAIASLLREAELLELDEKFDQAERRYLDVLKLDSRHVETYELLGRLYYRQRRYDEARQTFEFLTRLHGGAEAGYGGLGLVAAERGDLAAAAAAYRQSLRLNPDVASVHYNLAKVHAALDDLDSAAREVGAAIALEPANPRYLDYGVEVAILQRDRSAAQELLDRLAEANPENTKLAQHREAIEALGRAVS